MYCCVISIFIDYYTRVENSDNPLISAAFHEQVTLDLDWFSNISTRIAAAFIVSGDRLISRIVPSLVIIVF